VKRSPFVIFGLGILSPSRLLTVDLCITPWIHVVIMTRHYNFYPFVGVWHIFFKFHGGCLVWKICRCNI
jgi:hypothetical protein